MHVCTSFISFLKQLGQLYVVFFEFIWSFYAYFESPFLANICEVKSKGCAWFQFANWHIFCKAKSDFSCWERVRQKVIFYDEGGRGVHTPPKKDDIIYEQPLRSTITGNIPKSRVQFILNSLRELVFHRNLQCLLLLNTDLQGLQKLIRHTKSSFWADISQENKTRKNNEKIYLSILILYIKYE